MSSFTVTLTGQTSELSTSIYPEIVLDPGYEYTCGLLDFTTYNSIPNINEENQFLYYIQIVDKQAYHCKLIIPVGSYELDELLEHIKVKLAKNKVSFDYIIDKAALRVGIRADVEIYRPNDSVLSVLGFTDYLYFKPSTEFIYANDIVRISDVNIIRIECNLVSGAYINGKPCHSIYEFASNKVGVGHKIIEQPPNVVYMPITADRINFIQVSIVDQNGQLINFRGEDITCRIHIKRGEKYL